MEYLEEMERIRKNLHVVIADNNVQDRESKKKIMELAGMTVELSTGDEGVSIVSSDNFIGEDTPAAQREKIAGFDCMDMESYAVVRAVRLHSSLEGKPAPKVYMLKAVSDGADGTIGDWSERVEALRPVLREALDNLIKEINDED